MLNSVGFRNSGKLDLSGKGAEIGLAVAIIAVIGLAIFMVIVVAGDDTGDPLKVPDKSRVKCAKCQAEWEIGSEERGNFYREQRGRGSRTMGGDCPKCGGIGTVYIMIKCPECGKYYMPIKATKPREFALNKVKDVCPHCNTGYVQWHMEHHRRK